MLIIYITIGAFALGAGLVTIMGKIEKPNNKYR
jgi:hypothetical protein